MAGAAPCVSGWEKRCSGVWMGFMCQRVIYIYIQIYIQGTCTYMHAYMYVGICMCVCVMHLQEIISHRCVVALMANGGDC